MAALGDIKVTWTNPTKTVGNLNVVLTKVRIYEQQPGVAAPVLAKELTTAAEIAAQTYTLVDYYTVARPYSFAMAFVNADGESALSPIGTDSVDVPQASAAPVVAVVPK